MTIDHDAAIARILIAKPQASLADIRRLVPQIAGLNDADLEQKLNYLRRHRGRFTMAKPTRRTKR